MIPGRGGWPGKKSPLGRGLIKPDPSQGSCKMLISIQDFTLYPLSEKEKPLRNGGGFLSEAKPVKKKLAFYPLSSEKPEADKT